MAAFNSPLAWWGGALTAHDYLMPGTAGKLRPHGLLASAPPDWRPAAGAVAPPWGSCSCPPLVMRSIPMLFGDLVERRSNRKPVMPSTIRSRPVMAAPTAMPVKSCFSANRGVEHRAHWPYFHEVLVTCVGTVRKLAERPRRTHRRCPSTRQSPREASRQGVERGACLSHGEGAGPADVPGAGQLISGSSTGRREPFSPPAAKVASIRTDQQHPLARASRAASRPRSWGSCGS